ncbi:MAG TPA: LLM class flavin-dependent oxidoreductase [Actinospica sp.]|jgi:alkanesulfonate monooxygenase SsuD/methylene tetrahydromethanopterin reductase-like flavin-dependent oxidoreductase (luciferase family)|nr:LLM class flavin-dependent oxidoreductase [Actinospica sp.]
MEICVHTEPTQRGASYRTLVQAASATAELGFDGFFRSDHYLQFGTPTQPAGVSDAWLSLAALARDTTGIRLGTLVTPVTLRSPVHLAVQVAQVDQMSDGRIELGIGGGWYRHEYEACAVPFPSDRIGRLGEAVEIITGLWRTEPGETFDYPGARYRITGAQSPVATVQRPGPPLIIGGAGGPRSLDLAVRHAREYNLPFVPPEEVVRIGRLLRERSAQIGRDVPPRLSVLQTVCCGKDAADVAARAEGLGEALRPVSFAGTPGEVADRIGRYAEAGVERVYLRLLDVEDLGHLELLGTELLPRLR